MYKVDKTTHKSLWSLLKQKKSVEQELERNYLRDNIFHYQMLETQYNNILTKIDKLTLRA